LVYKTLIERNYVPENIFVLSANGKDGRDTNTGCKEGDNGVIINQILDLDSDGNDDIAYSARKTEISTVFDLIKNKLAEDYKSNVFIYVTDHGYIPLTGHTPTDVRLCLWDKLMSPAEFITELRKLSKASFIQIIMDQCYSGGFADEIKKTDIQAVIATSTDYKHIVPAECTSGIYILEWINGIRGKKTLVDGTVEDISYTVDVNHDDFISFEEASSYASKQVDFNNMNPQYGSSPFSLGSNVAMDNLKPEAYCNNGKQDNGETGVDCGGSCGNLCGPIIINGSGDGSCFDGKKNPTETDIDCGGPCLPCHFGKKLVNVLSVNECQCGNASLLPVSGGTPSMFSGLNIFNLNSFELSHGYFRHQFSYDYWLDNPSYNQNVNIPICGTQKKNFNTEESILNGGLIFEENNVQFVPYKKYILTFNYWYNPGNGIQFCLSNGLTNTYNNMVTSYAHFAMDHVHSHMYYTYKATTDILPEVPSFFNIGKVGQITPPNFCVDDISNLRPYDADYRNTEVSIIFTPDDYYKQLWVVGNNVFFNSLKIEELCIPDLVFNENNTKDVSRQLDDGTMVLETLSLGEARDVSKPSMA